MTAHIMEASPGPGRRHWTDDAACAAHYAETGDDPWFGPNEDQPGYNHGYLPPEDRARAKRICGGCPVKSDCLQYAQDHNEQEGIWGGLEPRDRRRLARNAA